jgi:hypothetical protein
MTNLNKKNRVIYFLTKIIETQIKQASANLIKSDEMGNQQVRMAVSLNHHFQWEGLEAS